jgi:hypothetical protein
LCGAFELRGLFVVFQLIVIIWAGIDFILFKMEENISLKTFSSRTPPTIPLNSNGLPPPACVARCSNSSRSGEIIIHAEF